MGAGFGGKWTCVYVWLSPFAAHLTYHNIVNLLYPSTKLKVKKKKEKIELWRQAAWITSQLSCSLAMYPSSGFPGRFLA